MGILTALREASVVSKVLGFGERTKVEADQKRGRSMTPKGGGLPSIEGDSADAPALKVEKFAGNHLPLETLFFLATLGGAEVCDMSERIGNFVVGKEFDALLVHTGQKEPGYEGDPFANQPNPALFIEEEDALETIFEKFLFAGDDRNVSRFCSKYSILPAERVLSDRERLCPRSGDRGGCSIAMPRLGDLRSTKGYKSTLREDIFLHMIR